MAITYVAWIDCPHQNQYGEVGFHELWMVINDRSQSNSYSKSIEQSESIWKSSPDTFEKGNQTRLMTGEMVGQDDLQQRLFQFQQGLPQCGRCPVNLSGSPVGCVGAIDTPIDEVCEKLLGDYFRTEVKNKKSAAWKFLEQVIAQLDVKDNAFNIARARGYEMDLTALSEPVQIKYGSFFNRRTIDTGLVLNAIFRPLKRTSDLPIHKVFFLHLNNSLRALMSARSLNTRCCKQVTTYLHHLNQVLRTRESKKWLVDLVGR